MSIGIANDCQDRRMLNFSARDTMRVTQLSAGQMVPTLINAGFNVKWRVDSGILIEKYNANSRQLLKHIDASSPVKVKITSDSAAVEHLKRRGIPVTIVDDEPRSMTQVINYIANSDHPVEVNGSHSLLLSYLKMKGITYLITDIDAKRINSSIINDVDKCTDAVLGTLLSSAIISGNRRLIFAIKCTGYQPIHQVVNCTNIESYILCAAYAEYLRPLTINHALGSLDKNRAHQYMLEYSDYLRQLSIEDVITLNNPVHIRRLINLNLPIPTIDEVMNQLNREGKEYKLKTYLNLILTLVPYTREISQDNLNFLISHWETMGAVVIELYKRHIIDLSPYKDNENVAFLLVNTPRKEQF